MEDNNTSQRERYNNAQFEEEESRGGRIDYRGSNDDKHGGGLDSRSASMEKNRNIGYEETRNRHSDRDHNERDNSCDSNTRVPQSPRKKDIFHTSGQPKNIDKLHSILVSRIPSYTTTKMLNEFFGKFGRVVDVYIPRDRTTSRIKSYAFVRYIEKEHMDAALQTNTLNFDGTEVGVHIAQNIRQRGRVQDQHDDRSHHHYRRHHDYRPATRSNYERRDRRSRSRSPYRRHHRHSFDTRRHDHHRRRSRSPGHHYDNDRRYR